MSSILIEKARAFTKAEAQLCLQQKLKKMARVLKSKRRTRESEKEPIGE